eukprot:tig00000430_g666.t1
MPRRSHANRRAWSPAAPQRALLGVPAAFVLLQLLVALAQRASAGGVVGPYPALAGLPPRGYAASFPSPANGFLRLQKPTQTGDAFTAELWIAFDAPLNGTYRLFEMHAAASERTESNSAPPYAVYLSFRSSTSAGSFLTFGNNFRANQESVLDFATPLSAGAWHHVAVTVGRSSLAPPYPRGPPWGLLGAGALSTLPLLAGARLADVRVWATERTAAQVAGSYEGDVPSGNSPALLLSLPLASSLADESSELNAASVVGASGTGDSIQFVGVLPPASRSVVRIFALTTAEAAALCTGSAQAGLLACPASIQAALASSGLSIPLDDAASSMHNAPRKLAAGPLELWTMLQYDRYFWVGGATQAGGAAPAFAEPVSRRIDLLDPLLAADPILGTVSADGAPLILWAVGECGDDKYDPSRSNRGSSVAAYREPKIFATGVAADIGRIACSPVSSELRLLNPSDVGTEVVPFVNDARITLRVRSALLSKLQLKS